MNPIKILEEYWSQTPVPIFDIIRDMGVYISFKILDDQTSGWIERNYDGSYEITINASHSETRRRFTAAHELGHYVYHRDLLGEGVSDDRSYRQLKDKLVNPRIRIIHERQANSFAANVLMPKHALESVSDDITTASLAEKFHVSEASMKIRLGR